MLDPDLDLKATSYSISSPLHSLILVVWREGKGLVAWRHGIKAAL